METTMKELTVLDVYADEVTAFTRDLTFRYDGREYSGSLTYDGYHGLDWVPATDEDNLPDGLGRLFLSELDDASAEVQYAMEVSE